MNKSAITAYVVWFLIVLCFSFVVFSVVLGADFRTKTSVPKDFDISVVSKDDGVLSSYLQSYCRMRSLSGTYVDFKEFVDCNVFMYEIL